MIVRGFYAVLDRDDEALARTLVGAGGARLLQIRIKPGDAGDIARIARVARKVCDELGAKLVINDRIDIALAHEIPVVAIGGITPSDARDIYARGASAICAIAAVNRAPDVAAAARALAFSQS